MYVLGMVWWGVVGCGEAREAVRWSVVAGAWLIGWGGVARGMDG